MSESTGANPHRPDYRVKLTDLEREARVDPADRTTEVSEAPAESPISPDKLNRMKLLGIVGDGRW